MPAFDNGMALGADGLEIDVQLSADGIPVVIHDHTLDRTTDRTGPVRGLTADELARSMRAFVSSSTARRRFAARASACRGSMTCWRASASAHHHRDEGRPAGAGARGGGVDRRRTPSIASASDRSISIDRHDARRSTGDRRPAHRSRKRGGRCIDRGCGGRGSAASVCRLPGARDRRPHARRVAGVRPARPSRRPRAAGVGRQRREPTSMRLLDWGVDGIISDRPDIAVAPRRTAGISEHANDHIDRSSDAPTLHDVYVARERVAPHVPRTPLMRHPLLDEATGLSIWVKHENHNPTCAFKVRGGLNLVGAMTAEERARGIVTASTGNHGQSIGLASRIHGVHVHGVRARRQQPRQERGDARVRRDGRRGRQGFRRSARALRAARRARPARATCIRPTSRC